MSIEGLIELDDGRRLAYCDYGAPEGVALLLCHGIPGSRLAIPPVMAASARALGVRLLVADRPGFGASDAPRSWLRDDGPRDMAALLDALGIARCRLVGYSISGRYALHCASALPTRVIAVELVGALAPEPLDAALVATLPAALRDLLTQARDAPARLAQGLSGLDAEHLFALYAAALAPEDRALLARPELAAAFRRACVETLRQGVAGIIREYHLAANAWPFALDAVRVPVRVWHGRRDRNVPPAMATRLADRLPQGEVRWLEDAGHLCLFTHWQDICRLGEVA